MEFKSKAEALRAADAELRKSLGAGRAAALLCGDSARERWEVSHRHAVAAERILALLPTLPD